MLGVLLAASLAAGAAVVAWRERIRIHRFEAPDAGRFARGFAVGGTSATEALCRVFPDAEPALVEFAASGTPTPAAVAAVNEWLGEIDHDLSRGRDLSKRSVRVALFAAMLGAIVELSAAIGNLAGFRPVAAALLVGSLGAAVAYEGGRSRDRRAGSLREEWDRVARVIERRVAGMASPPEGP